MSAKCCGEENRFVLSLEEQLDNADGFIVISKCCYTKLLASVSIPSSLVKLWPNLCLLITLNSDIFFIISRKESCIKTEADRFLVQPIRIPMM